MHDYALEDLYISSCGDRTMNRVRLTKDTEGEFQHSCLILKLSDGVA